MFDIHIINLNNFRSYRGTHKFEFPDEVGLYFLTGKNNPALGSNGAGKSTFLDAITWALYGHTTRGLKAGEVISWGASSCQVEVEISVGPDRFKIKRTQKPNTLLLDDNPIDQDALEKHIRLNYNAFVYSVINPQFGVSFLAQSPATKLNLFSSIMNLDFWLTKSEEAFVKASSLEFQIDQIDRNLAHRKGQLETVLADIEVYNQAAVQFTADRQIKIDAKRAELHRASDAAVTLEEKIAEITTENKVYLEKLEGRRDYWLDEIQKYAREKAECTGKMQLLKRQLDECRALGEVCPTCRQAINKKNVEARSFAIDVEISQLGNLLPVIEEDLDFSKKQMVKTNGKIDGVMSEISDAKDKQAEARILNDKVLRLKSELKEIKGIDNPYIALLAHKQEKLVELRTGIAIDTATKHKAEAEHEAVNFWVKGFKRVRLFLIEQAFRTLELEINNSLAQLGMPDWQITFDVERENKSGGVTKGFAVFVKSPENKMPVRWESWSGGETQRLQLAGDLGLANLIMQQAGLTNTIEFYDEPSTHLSTEGMLDLANMLHERAISEGKKIWIVDHAAITNFGEFKGIITVKRTKDGSVISKD